VSCCTIELGERSVLNRHEEWQLLRSARDWTGFLLVEAILLPLQMHQQSEGKRLW